MTEIDPDAELRQKIHHMIETMDKEEFTFVVLTRGYRAIVDQRFYQHINHTNGILSYLKTVQHTQGQVK